MANKIIYTDCNCELNQLTASSLRYFFLKLDTGSLNKTGSNLI